MPLQIIRQDITKMQVDAIVNTTNEEMIGYSGVDLAVHTVAGSGLDEECAAIAPLGLGQAKITKGYNLPCKYIIHTSGPRWRGGLQGEPTILRSCYVESLKLAVKHGCSSIAFPLISAGVYQYPKDQVLKFAIQTITEFLFDHELNVYICVYDKDSYTFSQRLFQDIKEFIDDEYVDEHNEDFYDDYEAEPMASRAEMCSPIGSLDKSLEKYLCVMDKPFAYKLFALIDEKGMTDVECYKKANVTHAHERSIMGCYIYGYCLSFLLKEATRESLIAGLKFAGEDLDYLPEFEHYQRLFLPDFEKLTRDEIKSTGYVVDTLEAALWCVLTTNDYKSCVLKAVNLGGDTDTIAAIAGGLAGALYGYESIPREWLESLLRREYIENLCTIAVKAWQSHHG